MISLIKLHSFSSLLSLLSTCSGHTRTCLPVMINFYSLAIYLIELIKQLFCCLEQMDCCVLLTSTIKKSWYTALFC